MNTVKDSIVILHPLDRNANRRFAAWLLRTFDARPQGGRTFLVCNATPVTIAALFDRSGILRVSFTAYSTSVSGAFIRHS